MLIAEYDVIGDLKKSFACSMASHNGCMKAAVMHKPGGPEVLKIETRPIPVPKAGQVLIAVKAFGINRSELFTRCSTY